MTAAKTNSAADPNRTRDLAAIHAMQRELALTEACYRALVGRISEGRTDSAGALNATERRCLRDELRRLGAGRKPSSRPPDARQDANKKPAGAPRPIRPANSAQQAMIRGLWLELAGLGIVAPGEDALAGFVRRQAKVDALQFVTQAAAQSVIGALRAWVQRAERAGERAAERAGERAAERAGERAAERAGERAAERAGERSAKDGG